MNRSAPFPSVDVGQTLQARLLAGDATAAGDVCSAFLEPLIDFLKGRFPRDDPDLWHDAASRAVVGHVKHPKRFDPRRQPDLGAYLRMAARGDALNLRQREARHHRGRKTVELDALPGNQSGDDDDGPFLRLLRIEEETASQRVLDAVERTAHPADRAVMRLLLDNVKATAAYAAAMGIAHLPIEDQARMVKRAKDRVKKRLGRFKLHA